MAGIVGVFVDRLLIGRFGFGVVFLLRIGVAQQIVNVGRRRIAGSFFEEVDGFLGPAFIHQELAKLLKGGAVVGIALQNSAKNFFGFVVAIFESIQTRQPKGGKRIIRLNL